MKKHAWLTIFALWAVPLNAVAETPPSSTAISIARSADGLGWDITLPQGAEKTLTDQLWLVVDGKPEGCGGGYFPGFSPGKPMHYTATVSSDLDGQVKDILKAQGFAVRVNTTTYSISFGVNNPSSGSFSKTLHFRHQATVLLYSSFPAPTVYKVGDKITLCDAFALDASVTPRDVFGSGNLAGAHPLLPVPPDKYALPADLLHRITIEVQFVPISPAKTAPNTTGLYAGHTRA